MFGVRAAGRMWGKAGKSLRARRLAGLPQPPRHSTVQQTLFDPGPTVRSTRKAAPYRPPTARSTRETARGTGGSKPTWGYDGSMGRNRSTSPNRLIPNPNPTRGQQALFGFDAPSPFGPRKPVLPAGTPVRIRGRKEAATWGKRVSKSIAEHPMRWGAGAGAVGIGAGAYAGSKNTGPSTSANIGRPTGVYGY